MSEDQVLNDGIDQQVLITLPTDTDVDLYNLLVMWKIEELYHILREADVTFESLRYLSSEDIRDAIKSVGLRAQFREKLFVWRKEKYGIEDETLSAQSKMLSWLTNFSKSCTPSSSTEQLFTSKIPSLLDISKLLKSTSRGRPLQNFYSKNGQLLDFHRQQLISIILEDYNYNGTALNVNDFQPLAQQIVNLFPTECKEYYFVPRQGKKNPKGKLYDKYINLRAKIKKVNSKPKCDAVTTTEVEFDESIAQAIKATLSRNCNDWDQVKDSWKRTFLLRRKELMSKSQSNVEFLKAWPRYKDSKGYELIQIDFRLLYPNKEHLLFSKWSEFKTLIGPYYDSHIHDKSSREIFASSKQINSIDSIDYIYAILLNAIILPTARFKDVSGIQKRKATIKDAQESFTLHLISINNYKTKVGELISKYYNAGFTIQPFIIIVGSDCFQIESFFVYFDNELYKLNSFLECMDTCFKIRNKTI